MTERRIHVVQGEYRVTTDRDVVLTTMLGSCVAACLRDPIGRVGGMNHFLLPGSTDGSDDSIRYGVHAMELLLNGLFKRGARRERLEAKLFGGAKMFEGLTDVGGQNALFAEQFIRSEGIRLLGGSLGGEMSRRIQFWPLSGRVRQKSLANDDRSIFDTEKRRPVVDDSGGVELFQ